MFYYNYTKLLAHFICCVFLFVSCQSDLNKPEPADVSEVEVDVTIDRFEQDFLQIDTTNLKREVTRLLEKYPLFFDCYAEHVMGFKHPQDTTMEYLPRINSLLNYGGFRAAYDSTMDKYSDISFLREDAAQAFTYVKHYFPDKHLPELVTFISEYSYGVITCGDSIVGIGLDMYLGKDFTFYPSMRIPEYMIGNLAQPYIMPNVMKQVYNTSFSPKNVNKETMLKRMINNGRRLYFLDLTLPYTKDWFKIGFREKELKWCRKNEDRIWGLFIEKEFLYSNKYPDYRKYVSPAPHSPGMPHKAPGNTGTWIGWQIVRKFMADNPGVTFTQLLNDYTPKQILMKSDYKPKRSWL